MEEILEQLAIYNRLYYKKNDKKMKLICKKTRRNSKVFTKKEDP